MKIIKRYVLHEHVGPFLFSLSALTSLLFLQVIARRFGDLVGKGLSWSIIFQFFALSLPYTLAMTFPMAVLVAVLYAFSRLAGENEITALKAGGVSMRALLVPVVIAACVLAIGMLEFNDQLLPRTNHRLSVLQTAIAQTKPTFALKEQVINTVKEGQLYLRAAHIDRATGGMKDVAIYDQSDPTRRRSIYADSGVLAFAANHRDLMMDLYHGVMFGAQSSRPGQLDRLYYTKDRLKIGDVGNQFQESNADSVGKGEREMGVCEMQVEYMRAIANEQRAMHDLQITEWNQLTASGAKYKLPPPLVVHQPLTVGVVYCKALYLIDKAFHFKSATIAQVATSRMTSVPPSSASLGSAMPDQPPETTLKTVPSRVPAPAGKALPLPSLSSLPQKERAGFQFSEANLRHEDAIHHQARMGVEIEKKFSLAAACIVFVLVGAPIALRFPRGGVGLVIAVSFVVFGAYYVGLIGGESLANKNLMSPFWAMWGANVVFLLGGIPLLVRMGRESSATRGGGFAQIVDNTRAWFQQRREGRGTREEG